MRTEAWIHHQSIKHNSQFAHAHWSNSLHHHTATFRPSNKMPIKVPETPPPWPINTDHMTRSKWWYTLIQFLLTAIYSLITVGDFRQRCKLRPDTSIQFNQSQQEILCAFRLLHWSLNWPIRDQRKNVINGPLQSDSCFIDRYLNIT